MVSEGTSLANKPNAADADKKPPVLNKKVGRVLERAYSELWHPRTIKALELKSGLSDETIRRLRKGDIREGRSVPPYCDAVGISANDAMEGRFTPTPTAVPSDPVHAMLEAIKDTPMGRAIIAQIQAAHGALAPSGNDR
jgi:hypothetical protein